MLYGQFHSCLWNWSQLKEQLQINDRLDLLAKQRKPKWWKYFQMVSNEWFEENKRYPRKPKIICAYYIVNKNKSKQVLTRRWKAMLRKTISAANDIFYTISNENAWIIWLDTNKKKLDFAKQNLASSIFVVIYKKRWKKISSFYFYLFIGTTKEVK